MAEHSFKVESGDNQMIANQVQIIRNLVSQRDQIVRQIQREVDFVNTVFRAASAEAKLVDEALREVEIPKLMIHPDGRLLVQIRDGVATWTSPDEGEGEGDQNEESEAG